MDQATTLFGLISAHHWLPLFALLVTWATALCSRESLFPASFSRRWLPLVAVVLAMVSSAVKAVVAGDTWGAWALHSALTAFLALGGYAVVVKSLFDDDPPAWLKALALIFDVKPPTGGGGSPYRQPAAVDVEVPEEPPTKPTLRVAQHARADFFGATGAVARTVGVAVILAGVGIACLGLANACTPALRQTVISDLTPAASCIVGALAEGGASDPMVIVASCAGTTIADVIKVIGDLLENAPDAGAVADGGLGVGMSPSWRAHLIDVLQRAYAAKAAAHP